MLLIVLALCAIILVGVIRVLISKFKKYRKRKKDRIKLRNWRLKNKDKAHEYWARNKDAYRAANRRYKLKNREKVLKKRHEYYSKNKDELNARVRAKRLIKKLEHNSSSTD